MSAVAVSVVIPVHNGERLIGEAIRSVLEQTYDAFEVIVVDDGSTDDTARAVAAYRDPRVRLLAHGRNRGLHAARNTGIRAARADILAFLDHDDLFHRDKLGAHVHLLTNDRPDIGFSYNARFELNHGANTIREIWLPPASLTLADCVLGFPVAPSDMVIRRRWLETAGLWEEAHGHYGGEIILTGRLHFAGCAFARINRVLNYRRRHAGRVLADVAGNCQMELDAQHRILTDPRCPREVAALHDAAWSNTYLAWAWRGLVQGELPLGQKFVREAMRLNPSLLCGTVPPLLEFVASNSLLDESLDHEALLPGVFAALPSEVAHFAQHYPWAAARGHLIKAMRAIMWERVDDADVHLANATRWKARADDALLGKLAHQLLEHEIVFGSTAARAALARCARGLTRVAGRRTGRRLRSAYWAGRAFLSYNAGAYSDVPTGVLRALGNQPCAITNRGLLAILLRSLARVNVGQRNAQSP